MISFQLNDIIKILTTISVILIPANLVVGIFGMNTIHDPIIGNPYDFWIVVGIISAVIVSFYIWFRRKGWL
jgi:magnesium transporter